MTDKLNVLTEKLQTVLGDRVVSIKQALQEVTLEVSADNWLEVAYQLRDNPALRFEQLTDACGIDYSAYREGEWQGARFATAYQLISYEHNIRMRVRVFCPDDEFPVVASVVDVWPGINWFERESFDLFGIVYQGHPDLRRLLTDYGFVGHPFRKDFPVSGYVEMRYDADEARVVYQPVTIDPRENTPRIIREENYGGC